MSPADAAGGPDREPGPEPTEPGPDPEPARAPGHRLVAEPGGAQRGLLDPTGPAGLNELDVGELARAIRSHERAEAERVARERLDADAWSPTPCTDCGTNYSTRSVRGELVGGWHADAPGLRCHHCHLESREQGSEQLAPRDEWEYRDRTVRALLAPLDTTGELRQWRPGYLAERAGFTWWRETPDAPGGGRERFAYFDRHQALARLTTPPATTPLVSGPQDPICGCSDAWEVVDVRHHGVPGMVSMPPYTERVRTCRAHLGTPEDLDEAVAAVVGLHPRPGLGGELGVSWWADHLAAMPLRQRLRARTRRRPWKAAATRPFAWWPSRGELLARAHQLYGPREGEWARTSESRWRDLASMRAAEAVAGELARRVQDRTDAAHAER